MLQRKIVLTWEAIYDIAEIVVYIEDEFGVERAVRFREEIEEKIRSLSNFAESYPKSGLFYHQHPIYKYLFLPSIVFYLVEGETVHVLRVLRHERKWEEILSEDAKYTCPGDDTL